MTEQKQPEKPKEGFIRKIADKVVDTTKKAGEEVQKPFQKGE